jgi:hypothetical protein
MRLQFRNVTVIEDEGSGQTILEIEVREKRGVGYCKSTAGAVRPFVSDILSSVKCPSPRAPCRRAGGSAGCTNYEARDTQQKKSLQRTSKFLERNLG